MRKEDVVAFFDRCASHWDAEMIRNESNRKDIRI